MDLIGELRKTDQQLQDPYAEKMATAPIKCDDLRWAWRGWCCRLTENRRTHLMAPCPLAYKTGPCPKKTP